MKLPIALVFLLATLAASASESFQAADQRPAPAHPSMYSFSDLYRLTVTGGALAALPPQAEGEAPVRIAAAPAARATEASFTLPVSREPSRALMLLAGVAAAIWVARRRMGVPLG